MKKVLAIVIISLLVAPAAFAEGFALGYDGGLSVKFPAGPVGIQGVLGFMNISPQDDAFDSMTEFDITGFVTYPVIDMDDSKLNVFGGVGIVSWTDMDLDIAILAGLEPEVMVSECISVSGKVGLQIYMEGGTTDVDDSGSTTIGLWGSIGVHWHF